jgi:hypothetical protein
MRVAEEAGLEMDAPVMGAVTSREETALLRLCIAMTLVAHRLNVYMLLC